MSPARQLVLSVSLTALGLAYGCTTSEPYVPPTPGSNTSGTGGSTGTGGAMTTMGTGGAMDAGMEAAAPALTFAKDIMPLVMAHCAPCHTKAAMPDGGLSVNTLATITGTATTNCAKVDASKKRVVAGNPAASFLYIKITTPTAMLGAGCGNEMPRSGPPYLTAAQQTTIHDWIMQGAN